MARPCPKLEALAIDFRRKPIALHEAFLWTRGVGNSVVGTAPTGRGARASSGFKGTGRTVRLR
jgi:hypothetical protein